MQNVHPVSLKQTLLSFSHDKLSRDIYFLFLKPNSSFYKTHQYFIDILYEIFSFEKATWPVRKSEMNVSDREMNSQDSAGKIPKGSSAQVRAAFCWCYTSV